MENGRRRSVLNRQTDRRDPHQEDVSATGTLSTDEAFIQTNFVVDVRLKQAESSVVIDAGSHFPIDLADPAVAVHLGKLGRWNRIEAINQSGQRKLLINGQPIVFNGVADESAGKLVLKPTGPVDFSNLYAAPRAATRIIQEQ